MIRRPPGPCGPPERPMPPPFGPNINPPSLLPPQPPLPRPPMDAATWVLLLLPRCTWRASRLPFKLCECSIVFNACMARNSTYGGVDRVITAVRTRRAALKASLTADRRHLTRSNRRQHTSLGKTHRLTWYLVVCVPDVYSGWPRLLSRCGKGRDCPAVTNPNDSN
jgi:hypothetical protein